MIDSCAINLVESSSSIDLSTSAQSPVQISNETVQINVTVTQAPAINLEVTPVTKNIQLEMSPVAHCSQGTPSGTAWANFAQGTPKQVSVGTESTPILFANSNRLFGRISNNSSQTIYIQYAIPAEWRQGTRLSAGSSYIIDLQELYTGQINAITDQGSVEIDVTEGVL